MNIDYKKLLFLNSMNLSERIQLVSSKMGEEFSKNTSFILLHHVIEQIPESYNDLKKYINIEGSKILNSKFSILLSDLNSNHKLTNDGKLEFFDGGETDIKTALKNFSGIMVHRLKIAQSWSQIIVILYDFIFTFLKIRVLIIERVRSGRLRSPVDIDSNILEKENELLGDIAKTII